MHDPRTTAPIDLTGRAASRELTAVPASGGHARSRWLRRVLVVGDALSVGASVALVNLGTGWASAGREGLGPLDRIGFVVLFALVLMNARHLYRSNRSSIAAVEIAAITHVGVGLLVGAVVIDQLAGEPFTWQGPVLQALLAVVVLVLWRSAYRAYLRAARRDGRFERPVVVVGTDEEAARIVRLLADHPDTGLRCLGVVGPRETAIRNHLGGVWMGDFDAAVDAVRSGKSTGVVLVTSAVGRDVADDLVREVHANNGHVHLSAAVGGADHRRVSVLPVAHEPLLYVAAPAPARRTFDRVTKRAIDIVAATTLLVLASPLLLVAWIGITASSGGSVLFRQVRVGQHGRHFTMYKFRTMVPGAEEALDELRHLNHREGPLFKIDDDPRVTRVGRILRAVDIDELPQLFNVLRGEMSLVGPRPALPEEHEQFGTALRRRVEVMPGVTGLWQVEARDAPSFDAYQRLDLFYVDNWSISLDLVVLLLTVESKFMQFLGLRARTGEVQLVRPAATSPTLLPSPAPQPTVTD